MSTISSSTTSTTAYKVTADTTGTLVFQTGATPTTAITISTGQVATFAQAPSLPAASIPQAALAAGVAGNGPAFSAYASSTQTVTSGSDTKVQCNTKEFDTSSAYDNVTNYRFTPLVAGYYQVSCEILATTTTTLTRTWVQIWKNGALFKAGNDMPTAVAGFSRATGSALIYLNGSTDYLEFYVRISGTGTLSIGSNGAVDNYFQASLVRAV